MEKLEPFHVCNNCMFIWRTRDSFLDDDNLVLNGYQFNPLDLEAGLFLFTHQVEGCNTTIAVKVDEFADLYQGKIYPDRRTGEVDCPGFCKKEEQLGRCDAKCECAYVREIIQIIRGCPR